MADTRSGQRRVPGRLTSCARRAPRPGTRRPPTRSRQPASATPSPRPGTSRDWLLSALLDGTPARYSASKRVNDLHTSILEMDAVAGGDDEPVDKSCGGDEAVLDRHGTARPAETGEQFSPPQPRLHLPR